MSEIFANLLIAHILADFPFQPESWVEQKCNCKGCCWALLWHILVVGFFSYWALGEQGTRLWWVVCIVVVSHLVIDVAKVSFTNCGPRAFLLDQFLHISVLMAIIKWGDLSPDWVQWSMLSQNSLGLTSPLIALYLMCLWPANYLVRSVLLYCHVENEREKQLSEKDKAEKDENEKAEGDKSKAENNLEKINRSGALIGWLERVVILTFILMGNYQTAGLTITAKSLMRVADRDAPRSEYVLAGTLMSLAIALFCALIYFVCVMDAKLLVIPGTK